MANVKLDDLLVFTRRAEVSDLHLTVGVPPVIRIDGELRAIEGFSPLMPPDTLALAQELLNEEQMAQLVAEREMDLSFGRPGAGRYRLNVYHQRGSIGLAIRVIRSEVPTIDDLQLPPITREFAEADHGLVLVCGATGSGKSTTIAAMIQHINTNLSKHIITIEDPIEFLYRHEKSIINQRQVYDDTNGFKEALRRVLRQDPDVILVGEMRDFESIEAALTISETGHLVFATLHTSDAATTVSRIVDVFPSTQQQQARVQLSVVLQGVMIQQLLPRAKGSGRIMVQEILRANVAVRSMIRDNEIHQISQVMETHRREGMQTMNYALFEAFKRGDLTKEQCLNKSTNYEQMKSMLARAGAVGGAGPAGQISSRRPFG